MSVHIKIEDYELGLHLENIKSLFLTYFDKSDKALNSNYINWLYGLNIFGKARLVVAYENGEWIGFMALIPISLTKGSDRINAYYVVNVLVHPSHQGKHIFNRMITSAKALIKAEDSALLGHPNKNAIIMWRRAKMDFQSTLLPYFISPLQIFHKFKLKKVTHHEELADVCELLQSQSRASSRWNVDISTAYFAWRYLEHPVAKYNVMRLELKGKPIGIFVYKKIIFGLNMVVDRFILEEFAQSSFGAFPMWTVCFIPKSVAATLSGRLWPMPTKKIIPFFFTKDKDSVNAVDSEFLGLSASDF